MRHDHSPTTDILSIVVRVMGLVVLTIGLFIGIKVIFEAWNLYDQPQRIERFADAIEHGSNLDKLLTSFTDKATISDVESEPTATTTASNQDELRVTYFLAWFIAVLLLMVIGGLASSAIRTGGQLALYDLQVKRFANLLIKEVRQSKSDKEDDY